MAETLCHPGAADGPRLMLAPTRVERRRITLAADMPIHDAILGALDGADSAWITLHGGRGDLHFVLPDRSRDGVHAAWYSAPHDLKDAIIHRAGIVWGRRDGRAFGHCHGLWDTAMGHLLLEDTVLTHPVQAEAWLFDDAVFEARRDAETAFTLFKPQGMPVERPDAALLRIAPHVELAEGLRDAMGRLGWEHARLAGLGSLNTARFDNGEVLDSHATEFLVRDGWIDRRDARAEIDIVGIGGARAAGKLSLTQNPVCVTAELILLKS